MNCVLRFLTSPSLALFSVLSLGASPFVHAAPGGFLFVTFKGEQSPMTEQIYFSLSPDGRHWQALNNSEPVLGKRPPCDRIGNEEAW